MISKKSNDRSNPKNWRPISITSCLMRLFEKVMLKRLNSFLNKNNILIRNQSGFRAKRSTHDNLFFVAQKAYECYNRGWSMLSIFFDIEAAFDKVWHDGLIYKLSKIKIPFYILKFLINFLRNRKFRVKVGDSLSFEGDIECGVPQGGVVSPTLFSIDINDAPQRNKTNH
jgi:retron-type reverse transcriptase